MQRVCRKEARAEWRNISSPNWNCPGLAPVCDRRTVHRGNSIFKCDYAVRVCATRKVYIDLKCHRNPVQGAQFFASGNSSIGIIGAFRTWSCSTSTTALITGFTSSRRRRQLATASQLDIWRARIAAASSEMHPIAKARQTCLLRYLYPLWRLRPRTIQNDKVIIFISHQAHCRQ